MRRGCWLARRFELNHSPRGEQVHLQLPLDRQLRGFLSFAGHGKLNPGKDLSGFTILYGA